MDSESRHSSSLQMSEGDSLTTRSNEEVEASISSMQRKKMKPRSDVWGHFDKIVDGAGIQRAFLCLFATMMAVSISGLYMGSKHSGANTRASDMRDFGEKVLLLLLLLVSLGTFYALFSKPFTVGDTIKVGAVEPGLTTTTFTKSCEVSRHCSEFTLFWQGYH